jgi:tRNA nucleotidyltransferase (CCA-adding enzyme)
MKDYLNKLPKEIQDLAHLASDIAAYNNMPVYLVGGFVRDLLLGVENLDLDMVVEGDGIKFAEYLCQNLKAKLTRHRRFGTATIVVDRYSKIDTSTSLSVNGESFDSAQDASKDAEPVEARRRTIDIATCRREFYPQPAHLPIVEPGLIKDDLYRRDFSINAMAINISENGFGKLIDFFGGKTDLNNKRIRVLHNLSFIDDPTRILRAIRFEKRYNFRIEPGTLKLLKDAIRLRMLERVEPQRIRDDIILMLKEKKPQKEIRRLEKLVGFNFISPHIRVSKSTYQLLGSIQKEIIWFKKEHPERRHLDTWLMYFIGLIDSLDISQTKNICQKFAFHKGEVKRILTYKGINRKFVSALNKEEIMPSKVYSLLEPQAYEVLLVIKAKYKGKKLKQSIENFLKNFHGMRTHITGYDLERLGIAPGPVYQKILEKVLNARLDGLVKTKKEELDFIKRLLIQTK